MASSIFMSYSRREVGFVDDLTYRLEKEDFKVWLDYRSLIPGTPWAEQINKGLDESEVIVLVVSKESLASKYVELEWRRILKIKGKRVILAIFEAVDIPPELENLEWVDFRGNYETAVKELVAKLNSPVQKENRPPETGFKIPAMIWVAFVLSIILSFYSIGSIWTFFIPWLLIPLPYRILKRNYNFTMVQAALIFLPFALFMSSYIAVEDNTISFFEWVSYSSVLFVIPLIFILRSPALQRWGKPDATMPKFANPYKPDIAKPEPTSFFIDFALQDASIANELARTLESYGHPRATDISSAKAVFVLISNFKKSTQADPEQQVVFPIILQTVNDIDPNISKVQWIDFRRGVRNMDVIAKLLPEPASLLKALGIRPMGNNLVLPPAITAIVYFFIALAIFTVGSWIPYFYQYSGDIADFQLGGMVVQFVVSLLLFGVISYYMAVYITQRRGWLASTLAIILAMLLLGAIMYWQYDFDGRLLYELGIEEDYFGFSSYFPPILYIAGNIGLVILIIVRWKEWKLWFPAKGKS